MAKGSMKAASSRQSKGGLKPYNPVVQTYIRDNSPVDDDEATYLTPTYGRENFVEPAPADAP